MASSKGSVQEVISAMKEKVMEKFVGAGQEITIPTYLHPRNWRMSEMAIYKMAIEEEFEENELPAQILLQALETQELTKKQKKKPTIEEEAQKLADKDIELIRAYRKKRITQKVRTEAYQRHYEILKSKRDVAQRMMARQTKEE